MAPVLKSPANLPITRNSEIRIEHTPYVLHPDEFSMIQLNAILPLSLQRNCWCDTDPPQEYLFPIPFHGSNRQQKPLELSPSSSAGRSV